jgi:hypothetical protein
MEKSCEKCRYWRFLREEPDVGVGECRRHAPVVKTPENVSTGLRYAEWPATMFDDWCGEFVPKT